MTAVYAATPHELARVVSGEATVALTVECPACVGNYNLCVVVDDCRVCGGTARAPYRWPCPEDGCRGGEVSFPEWEGRVETCPTCDGLGTIDLGPLLLGVVEHEPCSTCGATEHVFMSSCSNPWHITHQRITHRAHARQTPEGAVLSRIERLDEPITEQPCTCIKRGMTYSDIGPDHDGSPDRCFLCDEVGTVPLHLTPGLQEVQP